MSTSPRQTTTGANVHALPTVAAHAGVHTDLPRNPGMALDLGWLEAMRHVNRSALERRVGSMTKREWPDPFTARATDVRQEWQFGVHGGAGDVLTVTGPASLLGWWLTGRGNGEGLTSDRGELPKVGAW